MTYYSSPVSYSTYATIMVPISLEATLTVVLLFVGRDVPGFSRVPSFNDMKIN